MDDYPREHITGARMDEIRAAILSGDIGGKVHGDGEVWATRESLNHYDYMRAMPVPAVAA